MVAFLFARKLQKGIESGKILCYNMPVLKILLRKRRKAWLKRKLKKWFHLKVGTEKSLTKKPLGLMEFNLGQEKLERRAERIIQHAI